MSKTPDAIRNHPDFLYTSVPGGGETTKYVFNRGGVKLGKSEALDHVAKYPAETFVELAERDMGYGTD